MLYSSYQLESKKVFFLKYVANFPDISVPLYRAVAFHEWYGLGL